MAVYSRSNWNLEVLVFVEGGKPETPKKNPWSKDENQQQTQPTYMTPGPRFELGPHWWEASALATAPSLLPYSVSYFLEKEFQSRWLQIAVVVMQNESCRF